MFGKNTNQELFDRVKSHKNWTGAIQEHYEPAHAEQILNAKRVGWLPERAGEPHQLMLDGHAGGIPTSDAHLGMLRKNMPYKGADKTTFTGVNGESPMHYGFDQAGSSADINQQLDKRKFFNKEMLTGAGVVGGGALATYLGANALMGGGDDQEKRGSALLSYLDVLEKEALAAPISMPHIQTGGSKPMISHGAPAPSRQFAYSSGNRIAMPAPRQAPGNVQLGKNTYKPRPEGGIPMPQKAQPGSQLKLSPPRPESHATS